VSQKVAQLNYAIDFPSEAASVSHNAEPITVQFGDFSCEVTADQVAARPSASFDDVTTARQVLEPFLEAWSATTELFDYCPMAFRFTGHVYEHTDDEDPNVAHADVAAATVVTFNATAHVEHGQIPQPRLGVNSEGPLAAQLRWRWRRMERGGEPIPAASYYIVRAVKRYHSPQDLNISRKVLDDLQKLSAFDHPTEARKVGGHDGLLTNDDLAWMRTACRAIVQRVLEHEAGADTPRFITRDKLLPPS
jgi:hypothetical protein